jgi:hypothetical protein
MIITFSLGLLKSPNVPDMFSWLFWSAERKKGAHPAREASLEGRLRPEERLSVESHTGEGCARASA